MKFSAKIALSSIISASIPFYIWLAFLVATHSRGCNFLGLLSLNGAWLLWSFILSSLGIWRLMKRDKYAVAFLALIMLVINSRFLYLWLSAGKMLWLCNEIDVPL
jgi:hypothetical protein